jgi:hypothetical protein
MNSMIAGTVHELTFIKVKWTTNISYSAASVTFHLSMMKGEELKGYVYSKGCVGQAT